MWVDVNKKLPVEGKLVFISDCSGYTTMGYRAKEYWCKSYFAPKERNGILVSFEAEIIKDKEILKWHDVPEIPKQ